MGISRRGRHLPFWNLFVRAWIEALVPENERFRRSTRNGVGPHRELYLKGASMAPPAPNARGLVLDVSCGNGYGSVILHGLGFEVLSVDRKIQAKSAALFKDLGVRAVRADVSRPWIAAGSVQGAFSIETIEHLEDPSQFLRQLRVATRPSGFLVLSTPLYATGSPLHSRYHLREWTREELREMVDRSGWKVEAHATVRTGGAGWLVRVSSLAERLGFDAAIPPQATQLLLARAE